MSGFPKADIAFYENIGPIVGGLLAFQVEEKLNPKLPTGQTADLNFSPPVTDFNSLESALACLKAEHNENYVYRGQIKARKCSYTGRIPGLCQVFPHLGLVQFSFDGLIPSAFRSITSSTPANWNGVKLSATKPLDFLSSAARAFLSSSRKELREIAISFFRDLEIFRIIKVSGQTGARISQTSPLFYPGTNILSSHLQFIAIAQHYEHSSSMIDVTKSPEIAAWFASHRWSNGNPTNNAEGNGSIYRFNISTLKKAFDDRFLWGENVSPSLQSSGSFGVVDISTIDSQYAARPFAQQGASIFGLENSAVHVIMSYCKALEVFTFPHSSVSGRETGFSRSDLCPVDDPARDILKTSQHSDEKIDDQELTKLLMSAGMANAEVQKVVSRMTDPLWHGFWG